MNFLFVSSSNKEASLLKEHFSENYGLHQYEAVGISHSLCKRAGAGASLVSEENIKWANAIVCIADIHYARLAEMFKFRAGDKDTLRINATKRIMVLNIPVYGQAYSSDEYPLYVEDAIKHMLNRTDLSLSDLKLLMQGQQPYYLKKSI